jgi:hypothetical protein
MGYSLLQLPAHLLDSRLSLQHEAIARPLCCLEECQYPNRCKLAHPFVSVVDRLTIMVTELERSLH